MRTKITFLCNMEPMGQAVGTHDLETTSAERSRKPAFAHSCNSGCDKVACTPPPPLVVPKPKLDPDPRHTPHQHKKRELIQCATLSISARCCLLVVVSQLGAVS